MTELEDKAQDGGRLLRVSHGMLLAHEDKTYAGAFIASASIPWGQSKGDEDLGGYHLVWTRDLVQTATALLGGGKSASARRALVYLACSQRPDGSFAQNFWVNGNPYWGGIQLDEVAFPLLLTWRLWKAQELEEFDMLPFVLRAANFLVRQAPVTQQERWEENAGYSPSTLAVVIAGLICAADIARSECCEPQAVFLEEYADWIEQRLEEWTVTEDGVLLPEVKRHYMRIRPPQCGDPYAQPDCDRQIVHLSNQPPDAKTDYEAREIVDAGFLELVRYGVRSPDDPLIIDSLKVVDAVLKRDTPQGPAWRRYNHDGYGQQSDGGPYMGYGEGRCWPLLGGERAHYEVAAGRSPEQLIATYERFVSRGGMLPEQIWDAPDMPEEGLCFGRFSGSAMPLVWAHAEYLKLLRSATDGVVFDSIDIVKQRYRGAKQRRKLQIWKRRRHVTTVEAGGTLRIVAADQFKAHWSNDNWTTVHDEGAHNLETLGWSYDIDVPVQQTEPILFTLYWPQENRWEGQNFTVNIVAAKDEAMGASVGTAGSGKQTAK
jgi:glucoamylase